MQTRIQEYAHEHANEHVKAYTNAQTRIQAQPKAHIHGLTHINMLKRADSYNFFCVVLLSQAAELYVLHKITHLLEDPNIFDNIIKKNK